MYRTVINGKCAKVAQSNRVQRGKNKVRLPIKRNSDCYPEWKMVSHVKRRWKTYWKRRGVYWKIQNIASCIAIVPFQQRFFLSNFTWRGILHWLPSLFAAFYLSRSLAKENFSLLRKLVRANWSYDLCIEQDNVEKKEWIKYWWQFQG